MNALPARRLFCRQCDTRVSLIEAGRCASRFCKAKRDWPITSARYVSPQMLAVVSGSELAICEMIFAVAGEDQGLVAAIRAGSTAERLCRLRQAVIWVAKDRGFSFHKIARALNRDHSTVMHAYRIAQALRDNDPGFVATCEGLAA